MLFRKVNAVPREDLAGEVGDGSACAGVGLDGLFRICEDDLGEAAFAGLEVVADHPEQVDAPGGLGGEDELRHGASLP